MTLSQTMMAARVHRFGPPEVMSVEQTDIPQPGDGEILVRVHAAGVGPWDGWIRAGKSVLPQPLPLTLGSDISGIVQRVGANVSAFAPGDPVFGVVNARFTGGYAEYAAATANMMARKPDALSHIEAASVPVIAVTAWQMLFQHAKAAKGQTVFVHGGAGNVGRYAVQLAKSNDLGVIASAYDDDADSVRALGAGDVVDTRSSRLAEFAQCADAVIDTVGGPSQAQLFALLKPGGILVSAVSEPSPELAKQHGVRAMFMLVDVNTADLTRLAGMFDARELIASVGTVLPLAEARTAHEMMEGKGPRPRGKIVLQVAD
jgi:NADPH:quinone reductase-like Zn-dependent oxidoreductase